MALDFCWLSVFSVGFWIITHHIGVYADNDWSQHSLQYRLEDDPESDLGVNLELSLLSDSGLVRHRRYVPDSQPLVEYTRRDRLLSGPENIAPSRQTKETKFSDDKLADVPHPAVSENSAARGVVRPESTPLPPASPLPTATNKSIIISAEFDNGNELEVSSKPPDDDLPINKYSDEMVQNALKQYNITNKREDHHVYYNSTFMVDDQIGQSYWVDMNKREDVKVNHMLSKSHRRAATVKLSFDFPFYGHMVRNVTIATGGFLYTGEYVHSWLAATQYIAPLMANFDTSISNDSYIKYVDNGTAFTVQWEKVVLQDKPTNGEFTFQATLHASGDIVFVYQNVPVFIENIQDDQHPVKVGLSDAYIIDRTIFFVRRKTIYEYHRVNFKKEEIKNWTVIYLNALPTCMDKKDCSSCVTSDIGFECKWCPDANRCSTGTDRKRQDWLHNECERHEVSDVEHCDELTPVRHISFSAAASPETGVSSELKTVTEGIGYGSGEMADGVRMGGSSYLGAAFVLVLIAGIAVWTLYAYSNPHSYSGQILIRYRPSQWSWRRGEARYTAATIHM